MGHTVYLTMNNIRDLKIVEDMLQAGIIRESVSSCIVTLVPLFLCAKGWMVLKGAGWQSCESNHDDISIVGFEKTLV